MSEEALKEKKDVFYGCADECIGYRAYVLVIVYTI